jgi:hypothetical protein
LGFADFELAVVTTQRQTDESTTALVSLWAARLRAGVRRGFILEAAFTDWTAGKSVVRFLFHLPYIIGWDLGKSTLFPYLWEGATVMESFFISLHPLSSFSVTFLSGFHDFGTSGMISTTLPRNSQILIRRLGRRHFIRRTCLYGEEYEHLLGSHSLYCHHQQHHISS